MSDATPSAFLKQPPNALFLDVDGVLTNNQILLSAQGEESKGFFIPDGLGLALIKKQGIRIGFISGRASRVVGLRARELGIDWHFDGVLEKRAVLLELATREGVDLRSAVYVGDDLVDIAPMRAVGLPVAVANAHPAVKARACATTSARGGEGAVREVCEWILMAHGRWEQIIERHAE